MVSDIVTVQVGGEGPEYTLKKEIYEMYKEEMDYRLVDEGRKEVVKRKPIVKRKAPIKRRKRRKAVDAAPTKSGQLSIGDVDGLSK